MCYKNDIDLYISSLLNKIQWDQNISTKYIQMMLAVPLAPTLSSKNAVMLNMVYTVRYDWMCFFCNKFKPKRINSLENALRSTVLLIRKKKMFFFNFDKNKHFRIYF